MSAITKKELNKSRQPFTDDKGRPFVDEEGRTFTTRCAEIGREFWQAKERA